ncbi:MAG TPA: KH domain-containing protein [Brevefilum sp.]|nr:KH domain-containing protein [Brevefilum sp.]HOR20134.1 KH domain-containing protein [Brevefilum sp.]HPL70173.1 KH domain-containing protein [Brevefilum sp.]
MKGENLQGLVEFIARSLVDDPSEVKVNKYQRGSTIQLELNVSKEDMGRVIGKSGQVANAIRTLLKVAAAREGQQVNLDIVEPY